MKFFLLLIFSLSFSKAIEPTHFNSISFEIYLFDKEFEKIKNLNGLNIIKKEIETKHNSIRENKK